MDSGIFISFLGELKLMCAVVAKGRNDTIIATGCIGSKLHSEQPKRGESMPPSPYLARVALGLAEHAEAGRCQHDHLMTEEWAGQELSSVAQDPSALLLNKVTIRGWPTPGGVHDRP